MGKTERPERQRRIKTRKERINIEILIKNEEKDIEDIKDEIKDKDKFINEEDEKIKEYKSAIANCSRNPKEYKIDVEKQPKTKFIIGTIILVPITFYLIIFYLSASYSALFKTFEEDTLIAAIFDPDALVKGFEDGFLEGVLIITIPFVFMGLGYLIHMMQQERGKIRYVKITALFLLTFLFDVLLAYIIEQKIYDFTKTLDSKPFGFSIAIQEATFWMIIFAGFVTYIIWGLVFDIVMKEYEALNKFIMFKKEQEKLIEIAKEKQEKEQEAIKKLEKEKENSEKKISDLENIPKIQEQKMEQKKGEHIFNAVTDESCYNDYLKGWNIGLRELSLLETVVNQHTMEVKNIKECFVEKLKQNYGKTNI